MTLEVTLWAIPVASLTAAFLLIAVRAWRLTRQSVVGDALLLRALDLAKPPRPGEDSVERPIVVTVAIATPVPVIANARLCPVPIVVCGARREAALAG